MRDNPPMRVYFCGTRGSTSVSGRGQARYGSYTIDEIVTARSGAGVRIIAAFDGLVPEVP